MPAEYDTLQNMEFEYDTPQNKEFIHECHFS